MGSVTSTQWDLAAGLLTPAESALVVPESATSSEEIARGRAPAYWLITLALAVVLIESLLYHRRKVG